MGNAEPTTGDLMEAILRLRACSEAGFESLHQELKLAAAALHEAFDHEAGARRRTFIARSGPCRTT
jgi:hypothetical protein